MTAAAPDSVIAALGAIADAGRLAILVGVSGVVVPLGVIYLLARWRPNGSRGRAAAARAAFTLPAVLYAILALDYARADHAAPARARLARAHALPIIGALERHRGDRLVYPERLDALVPLYLSPSHLRAPSRPPLRAATSLRRTGEGYVLRVRWPEGEAGSGMCEWGSRSGQWYCSGI